MLKRYGLSYFNKNHLKFILILVLIDIISTITWYSYSSVEEWNPIMNMALSHSIVTFSIVKLLLSFLTIWILSKYISNMFSQIGIAIVLAAYSVVTFLHYFVFLFLLDNF